MEVKEGGATSDDSILKEIDEFIALRNSLQRELSDKTLCNMQRAINNEEFKQNIIAMEQDQLKKRRALVEAEVALLQKQQYNITLAEKLDEALYFTLKQKIRYQEEQDQAAAQYYYQQQQQQQQVQPERTPRRPVRASDQRVGGSKNGRGAGGRALRASSPNRRRSPTRREDTSNQHHKREQRAPSPPSTPKRRRSPSPRKKRRSPSPNPRTIVTLSNSNEEGPSERRIVVTSLSKAPYDHRRSFTPPPRTKSLPGPIDTPTTATKKPESRKSPPRKASPPRRASFHDEIPLYSSHSRSCSACSSREEDEDEARVRREEDCLDDITYGLAEK